MSELRQEHLVLQACLLLLVREEPGTRRDLVRRMRIFNLGNRRSVGRELRALARAGEVRASWRPFTTASGPRRRYRLTDRGMVQLHFYAQALGEAHDTLHRIRNDEAG